MSPSKQNGRVFVLDHDGKYLVPTSPANARRLLKKGEAEVKFKNPFTIILLKQVSQPNLEKRRNKMKITNFYDFFSVPKAVYVQNISNPIGILSLEFPKRNGQYISFKVPANRNPINLTNTVPFESIRESESLMRFLQPTPYGPPKLQLLTDDEYNAFYEAQQKILDTEADTLKETAQLAAMQINTSYDMRERVVPETATRVDFDKMAVEPQVNPKVLSTCQMLNPDTNENPTPLSAREALDIFNSLSLTMIDYEYIIGHTYSHLKKENEVLRKWAFQRQGSVNQNTGIIPPTSGIKRGRKPKTVQVG